MRRDSQSGLVEKESKICALLLWEALRKRGGRQE